MIHEYNEGSYQLIVASNEVQVAVGNPVSRGDLSVISFKVKPRHPSETYVRGTVLSELNKRHLRVRNLEGPMTTA